MVNIKTKKNNLLVKVLFFLSILFLLDFGIGKILKYFYFTQNSGILYRTTYALDSTRADLLILGTSTANHHYYSPAFEHELKMPCYNAGRDGNSIFYHFAVLRAALKRYIPKIIILDINVKEFQEEQGSYDRLSTLLPYYNYHPEIRPIVLLKSPFEKYKLVSGIYPYNSLLFTIAVGNAELNKSRENIIDENGYVPLNGQWHEKLMIDSSTASYKLDSEKINIFNSLIRDCINSKIKLFIFISPAFVKYQYPDQSIQIAQNIAHTYNIPFYNFLNDSSFLNNQNLFFDLGHLNNEGSKKYTGMVIDKIINERR